MINYEYWAEVVRVVDGDTIILDVDVGFRLRTTQPFRLLGVNCPEPRGESAERGKFCTAFVERTLKDHEDNFVPVRISTYKSPDSFGRWLASLKLSTGMGPNTDLVGDILIPYGWGVEWDGKGKNPTPWTGWDKYPNPNPGSDI